MSAPLTRTSAFAEVQDGDGGDGAGATSERVKLILPKWIYFKIRDFPFKFLFGKSLLSMSQNCCSMGLDYLHLQAHDASVEPTKHTQF